MPIPIPSNKAGRGLHRGLGYLFDSTLGYPGEDPSNSIPPHRRDVRPALRLWSTRRPVRDPVDPGNTQIVIPDGKTSRKIDHGNSDTGLGRWLHAACSRSQQDHAQTGNSRRRLIPNSPRHIAPDSPSLPQQREEQQSFGHVHGGSSTTPEDMDPPLVTSSARVRVTFSDTRRAPQFDRATLSSTLPESDSEPMDRRSFIRTFAKRQGVSTSALEAISFLALKQARL
jgi:hypothetical protein